MQQERDDHLQGGGYEPEDKTTGACRLMQNAGATDGDIPYEQLTLPVLSISRLQDRVFHAAAIFDKQADSLPAAEHIKWDNAGHLLPAEVPEQLAQALIEFGDKHAG